MTMKEYRISNKNTGHDFGIYLGDCEHSAIDAMCRDAGYESRAHATSVTHTAEDDLVATEVHYAPNNKEDREQSEHRSGLSGRHLAMIKKILGRLDDEFVGIHVRHIDLRRVVQRAKAELTLIVAECECVDLGAALNYDKGQEE